MKIWAKTEQYSEGKYLVVRRDGTVPSWPHFVIAGVDPCASGALDGYVESGLKLKLDYEYLDSIVELSGDFEKLSAEHAERSQQDGVKASDPDAGPHRVDNPLALAMMRGQFDVATLTDVMRGALDAMEQISFKENTPGYWTSAVNQLRQALSGELKA